MAKKGLKKDVNKLLIQLRKNLKRFSKDAGVFAKKGEKELIRASKIGRVQLDIVNLNIQKEKLYYDMGKKIASLRSSKNISEDLLRPYLQKLRKIETSVRNKKREIAAIKKGIDKQ